MGITILPPVVEDLGPYQSDSEDSVSVDSDHDVEMAGVSRAHKRPRLENSQIGTGIVTPGEVVTDDPQWMRWVISEVAQNARGSLPFFSLIHTNSIQRSRYLYEPTLNVHHCHRCRNRPEDK